MALKGQLLEIKNLGHYLFLLKVGIMDDALPNAHTITDSEESSDSSDDALPLEQFMKVYECKLDLRDADNPLSFPLGELIDCVEMYHNHEKPLGLTTEQEIQWKTGYIVDAIVSESFASDFLEVIHGDEWESASLFSEEGEEVFDNTTGNEQIPSPQALHLGRKNSAVNCPDCGAEVKAIVNSPDKSVHQFACPACGRHFNA